jgi:ADP-ribose pyrophosphatase YjhB (NUDIX family)
MHPHDERPYAFCPMCGGDLEPRSVKAGEPDRLVCARCGFIFYLDPKVAVGTLIRNPQHELALVRRAIEPGYGKWTFPGGFVDRGEPVKEAAVREAREEVGLDVRLDYLLNVYSYPGAPVIIVYVATMTGGGVACDDEGIEARFFAASEIPWGELAFRSTHDALTEYLAARR